MQAEPKRALTVTIPLPDDWDELELEGFTLALGEREFEVNMDDVADFLPAR